MKLHGFPKSATCCGQGTAEDGAEFPGFGQQLRDDVLMFRVPAVQDFQPQDGLVDFLTHDLQLRGKFSRRSRPPRGAMICRDTARGGRELPADLKHTRCARELVAEPQGPRREASGSVF